MIKGIDPAALPVQQRAQLIYAEAQAEMRQRLWQAAMGDSDTTDAEAVRPSRGIGADLLAALDAFDWDGATGGSQTVRAEQAPYAAPSPQRPAARDAEDGWDNEPPGGEGGQALNLGPNQRYAGAISAAAERTGFPPAALAAIVNAEAARDSDGRWNSYSRNPRSSAAGLGQFLSGTWQGETERKGTWLNSVAEARGWLDANGKVRPESRGDLLALRYDGEASIQAIADYGRSNIDSLRRKGIAVDGSVAGFARTAYLCHHLGLGDATRFLSGGLDSGRARKLLNAQIGSRQADIRIAAAGNATDAHSAWFRDYVAKNLRPERFSASRSV